MRRFAFLAIIVLAFTLTSCGGDTSPTVTPPPDATVLAMWTRQANDATRYAAPPPTATSKQEPTATAAQAKITPTVVPSPTSVVSGMLIQAFDNMRKLDSYHLTTVVISGTQQYTTDGDYSHANARYTETAPPGKSLTVMVVNGDVFTSEDNGQTWMKSDLTGLADLSITKTILDTTQSSLKYATSIKVIGDENIGADRATHIQATYSNPNAGLDLWIGNDAKAGIVVRKVQEADLTYSFSNFNVPLTFPTPVILPTPTYSLYHVVTYKVTGQGTTSGDITATNDTGGNDQKTVPVGWHQDYKFKLGDFYYLSVQNGSGIDSSSISCEVLVDGKSVKTATSNGAYAIATCSGTVGEQP